MLFRSVVSFIAWLDGNCRFTLALPPTSKSMRADKQKEAAYELNRTASDLRKGAKKLLLCVSMEKLLAPKEPHAFADNMRERV